MAEEITPEVEMNPQEDIMVLDEVTDPENGVYIGQTKWFNDKLGYGFITICDGDKKGKDIFVHHSGIKPQNSNYKTLRKGEYINFNIIAGMNGPQAIDITGINGGPLMCDVIQGFTPPPPGRANPAPPPPPTTQPPGWQMVPQKRTYENVAGKKPFVKNVNKYTKNTAKPMVA